MVGCSVWYSLGDANIVSSILQARKLAALAEEGHTRKLVAFYDAWERELHEFGKAQFEGLPDSAHRRVMAALFDKYEQQCWPK